MRARSRRDGRLSAVTVAVFTMSPVTFGFTRTSIVSVRDAPAASVPTLHVTTPLRIAAPFGMRTSVSCAGTRSVTSTFVAAKLLRLRTVIRYSNTEPARACAGAVLVMPMSGVGPPCGRGAGRHPCRAAPPRRRGAHPPAARLS